MANIKIIEMKATQVAEVAEKLKKAQSVVFFDYRGLTVEEVTNLRSEMRKAGVEYVVLKNTIVERAARENGTDESVKGRPHSLLVITMPSHPLRSSRTPSKSIRSAPSRAA